MKKLFALLLCALLLGGAAVPSGCGAMSALSEESALPVATIEMANGDVMKLELYPDVAPNTVANFIELANAGFYDGLIFHRVIPGFMIQGGDPKGTGMGGPGYTIRGEFARNGFRQNNLKHSRGVLSMARSMMPNSAGSQFFIMHADAPHLDGDYAAFGRVIEGMDVVDAIAGTPTGFQDRPVQDQRIKKATVDTFGESYSVEKYGR
jgi:peptidyl-prolyl cis-trans isomerase B (cyclophilin B)